jgi:Kef-type K+ transport system membrane component KefB
VSPIRVAGAWVGRLSWQYRADTAGEGDMENAASQVAGAASAVGSQAEHLVLMLLYQLIAIFVVTRIVVWFSNRFLAQTDAAGEILAGLVLGPSVLGAFFPDAMHKLFVPETGTAFTCIAQIGLVLLMFQIGMEFEFKDRLVRGKHAILAISAAGIAVPFALGFAVAPWFFAQMAEPRPDELSFRLFFAVSMSITAIPILGRIFIELGLSHTRTAALTIGAAAIDDICGWLILGVVAAMIALNFDPARFAWHIGALALYLAFVLLVLRPLLQPLLRRRIARAGRLDRLTISWLLILLFVSAAITSNLGVFAIIGGFIIGAALHDDRVFVEEWKQRVGNLVYTLFLPVFFAYTGLRTDIGALVGGGAWLQLALAIIVAFAGKFGGAYFAARVVGETPRTALTIGVCMNTRALMELIALNIGYDLHVLPRPMFTILVILAIVSTFMATPLIRWLMADERRGVEPAEIAIRQVV